MCLPYIASFVTGKLSEGLPAQTGKLRMSFQESIGHSTVAIQYFNIYQRSSSVFNVADGPLFVPTSKHTKQLCSNKAQLHVWSSLITVVSVYWLRKRRMGEVDTVYIYFPISILVSIEYFSAASSSWMESSYNFLPPWRPIMYTYGGVAFYIVPKKF